EVLGGVLDGNVGGHEDFPVFLKTVSSMRIRNTTEMRKTTLPMALVLGSRPERSMLQISTGSVTSKRDSRKATMNSSQLKVTERKKAARIDGSSIGAVTSSMTCQSFAPRSRAARSIFTWCPPIEA